MYGTPSTRSLDMGLTSAEGQELPSEYRNLLIGPYFRNNALLNLRGASYFHLWVQPEPENPF